MTHWQTRLWWSSLGPTTGGRDPEPTSTTQQELNFSNDDSFYQSKRYIVWKAMVYDIYLGLTSMEQKNNKVTFKTFEAKVPSYLQQKNNNAMSMSKRRTHEWYWEVTYVRDYWISRWAIAHWNFWWVVVSVYVEVWESVWVFRIIFQHIRIPPMTTNPSQGLLNFNQRWTVIVQLQIWLWKKPFVEKR